MSSKSILLQECFNICTRMLIKTLIQSCFAAYQINTGWDVKCIKSHWRDRNGLHASFSWSLVQCLDQTSVTLKSPDPLTTEPLLQQVSLQTINPAVDWQCCQNAGWLYAVITSVSLSEALWIIWDYVVILINPHCIKICPNAAR